MLNLIKTSISGAILGKNRQFKLSISGLDALISNAKTDPFVPIGAYLLVYLKHIGTQFVNVAL